jgi:ribosomal protein L11 methyltransferase
VVDVDAINLKLDPGLAFGTGTHATTALCLRWLARDTGQTLKPFQGMSVVDYGCGSGVLAIAAALLGAEHVRAVDIDRQAIDATRRNSVANGVAGRICAGAPSLVSGWSVDLLLANILFQPLMLLVDTLSACVRPGGALVLSGLLEAQVEPLRLRYNDTFDFQPGRSYEGWALMSAIRR